MFEGFLEYGRMVESGHGYGGRTMRRTVAVCAGEDAAESLRMALGLMLLDDHVDVLFMDVLPEERGGIAESIGLLREMGAGLIANVRSASFEFRSDREIALMMGAYDLVVT